MVQIIPYKSHAGYLAESLGQTLGEGLGNFTGSYFANKAIDKVLNDPSMKDASLSERQGKLQAALAPYGERGERMLDRRLQIEGQRQQENLIKKAKALSTDPDITPSEIALSLYEIAGPQGSKMVPQLTQMIMDQRRANPPSGVGEVIEKDVRPNLPGFLQQGESPYLDRGTKGEVPVQKMPPPSKEEWVSNQADKMGERYFPKITQPEEQGPGETRKPLKPPLPQKPIGPQEVMQWRQDLRKLGITDPAQQDEYINYGKNYRQELYNAEKEGHQNLETYRKERQGEDDRFMAAVTPNLEAQYGNLTPAQLNVWKGISRQFENAGSDEARYRNTAQTYDQLVYEPMRGFDTNARPLPVASIFRPGQIKINLDDNRGQIQDHINSIDSEDVKQLIPDAQVRGEIKNLLRDQYMTSMASKDWGVAQSAFAVSNLNDSWRKDVPKAPEPKSSLVEEVYYNGSPQERDRWIGRLALQLGKLGPEDSLILAREAALSNNYDDAGFNEALRIVQKGGKFQLSPYQLMESRRLSIPQRLDLDSIMNGKRSIFDEFRRKK